MKKILSIMLVALLVLSAVPMALAQEARSVMDASSGKGPGSLRSTDAAKDRTMRSGNDLLIPSSDRDEEKRGRHHEESRKHHAEFSQNHNALRKCNSDGAAGCSAHVERMWNGINTLLEKLRVRLTEAKALAENNADALSRIDNVLAELDALKERYAHLDAGDATVDELKEFAEDAREIVKNAKNELHALGGTIREEHLRTLIENRVPHVMDVMQKLYAESAGSPLHSVVNEHTVKAEAYAKKAELALEEGNVEKAHRALVELMNTVKTLHRQIRTRVAEQETAE